MQLEPSDISIIKNTYDNPDNSIVPIAKPSPSELITSLSSLDDSIMISRSNQLLVVIEIITNPTAYNPRYRPSQKIFWRQAIESPLLKQILSKVTLSSFRINYTLLQSNKEKFNDIITVIKENQAVIDSCRQNMYTILRTVIKKLKSEYSLEPFEKLLIETSHKMKLNPPNLHPLRNNAGQKIIVKKAVKPLKRVLNEEENEVIVKMLNQGYWERKVNPLLIKDKELESFEDIDDIVTSFQLLFPKEDTKTIMNVLTRNSMNIIKTYKLLINNNERNDERKGFTSANDYIIKNMKGSDIYDMLEEEKGIDNINERRRYLNISLVNDDYNNLSLI